MMHMSMRGFDISDWQKDIDINAVDYDFVICKATQGTSYVNGYCDINIQKAKQAGKPWGFYHFMWDCDPVEQADYFYANCKNYFGEGIPILDYEDGGRIGSDGAKRFLDRIYELTGVRCLFYTYRNVVQSPHDDEDWGAIAQNHALWVAQYANDEQTGYQDSPWLPGGDFGAWKTIVMHQYTSHGRLDGYGGNLDLDIAYMDADVWARYAKPGTCNTQPATTDAPSGIAADIAADVMRGKYGNGDERKAKLGGRFDEVQNLIDRAATASADDLASNVLNGLFGNGETRRAILGNRYDEVQTVVNGKANAVDIDALARAVIRGEYGDGEERKAKLGVNYDAVQKRVNELL